MISMMMVNIQLSRLRLTRPFVQRHRSCDEGQGAILQARASQPGNGTTEDEEHRRGRHSAEQGADLENEEEE